MVCGGSSKWQVALKHRCVSETLITGQSPFDTILGTSQSVRYRSIRRCFNAEEHGPFPIVFVCVSWVERESPYVEDIYITPNKCFLIE